MFMTTALGGHSLTEEKLKRDKQSCKKAANCGLGREALYLGSRFVSRFYYIPWKNVKRVFKRVAMSKGGFSRQGAFGSIAFLVVQYDGGEHECAFKMESELDMLLSLVEKAQPDIPTRSAAAEKKLLEAQTAEEARYIKELSPDAEAALAQLSADTDLLEERPSLYNALNRAASQKRVADLIKPSYRVLGIVLLLLSLLSAAFGLYAFITKISEFAGYFIADGAILFLFALSSNLMPNRWNSKKYAEREWNAALSAMAAHLEQKPDFFLPPQYAHPACASHMKRILREGRAQTLCEAYELMKSELKKLNSSVTVSQKEYDEVVAIKPMFLVCDYRDDIGTVPR